VCTNLWMTCAETRHTCVQRGDKMWIAETATGEKPPLPGQAFPTSCA